MSEDFTHIERICYFCGKPFWAQRANASYCSSTCRQAAFRWRTKLPQLRNQIVWRLLDVACYLDFQDSRRLAIKELKAIRRQIDAALEKHGET